jgi:superfamily II DNA or RNA helicase
MKVLREDQEQVICNLREVLGQTKRVVMCAPTGAGKTVIMSDMVNKAQAKDKKVLITVPAISLVDQTVQALYAQGVQDVGVIQAQHPQTDWSRPVQVASVQTLQHRWREQKMPQADLVLVDEVHRLFDMFANWIPDPAWSKVPFIGFSATPWSRGLGKLYDRLVLGNTITALIEQKVLVPFRTFAPDAPDLSGVRTLAGEFVAADLDEVMRPHQLVANIVETWKQMANGRPTVCFACSRAHADQLAKEFNENGIGAAYLDCESPMREREEVRARMLRGEVKVVCNVDVIGLGVDWPEVSCISYCRPTMSDIRYCQNIGRGLRSAPGKEDLIILDHSTTTMRLGFVDEIYSYHPTLDDGKIKPKKEVVLLPKECPACHLLKPPRAVKCPHCAHEVAMHADPVKCERGTLREVRTITDPMTELRKRLPDKQHVFGQLWWWALQKGYKTGYAAVKCKEIFGSFPRAREPEPETISHPTAELLNWLYTSTQQWARRQSYGRAKARINGYANSSDRNRDDAADRAHDKFVDSTFMTKQDCEDFR